MSRRDEGMKEVLSTQGSVRGNGNDAEERIRLRFSGRVVRYPGT